jgi:succinyl-diaminopimelate desuccinylase
MAHGAMPRKGRNPNRAMGNLLVALAGYEDALLERHGAHEHLGPNYVTPTVLEAGSLDQINVIPATARVAVDVRTIPGVRHDVLVDEVGALADLAGAELGVTAQIEVVDDRPPVEIAPGHPVVQAVVRAHEAEHGVTPPYGGVPGATDGTILWRDARIPNVVYGPGDKWIAHQADEWVAVEDLGRYARVYARAAHAFLTEAVGSS